MKQFIKHAFRLVLLTILLSSCGAIGIHMKVYNPKKPGAYPKETKQITLLARNTKYRSCFDVYHNELNVEVVPSKKFISGKVIISAKAVTDFDTLQIDLYKNMKIKTQRNKSSCTGKTHAQDAIDRQIDRQKHKRMAPEKTKEHVNLKNATRAMTVRTTTREDGF